MYFFLSTISITPYKSAPNKTVTNGMDDFVGFSPTETRLNQEIKELKDIVEAPTPLLRRHA